MQNDNMWQLIHALKSIQLHMTTIATSTTTTKLCTENEKYKNQEDIDNHVKH